MGYWLDYSAAKLPAWVIKNDGYSGVIRYIDSPDRLGPKHTNKAEYDDHISNGLGVLLVFEVNENDALGGFGGGQDAARRALAGANMLGYSGAIFFCADRWFNARGYVVITPETWQAYLDGAASIIGRERVGAYGFADAMDAGYGHASFYWQCGARSVVRNHVNIWQDNNYQPYVGGIQTDRNEILNPVNVVKPVVNNINGKEEDMALVANSYEPTVDAAGNLYTRRFVFAVPTQSTLGTIFAKAWLSVKSGWGPIEFIHIFSIGSGNPASYPVDKTWNNVQSDSERIVVEAPDGVDQFSVEIRSANPFGITIEAKGR